MPIVLIMAAMKTGISITNLINSISRSKLFRNPLIVLLALAGFLFTPGSLRAAPPLPGAIFTTDSTCTDVNVNIYDHKNEVYIDAWPSHPSAAGLPDGNYCVPATDPRR